jgi:ADP-ribosylglycohydrolase
MAGSRANAAVSGLSKSQGNIVTSSFDNRLSRARTALEGLSMGDAFGERFLAQPGAIERLIVSRALPDPPWRYTQASDMALSIVANLGRHGRVEQDDLARSFAERYDASRGYGPAMRGLLARIAAGEPWQAAAPSLFDSQGSYGNGAAMRAAPVGAFFANDLDLAVEQARRSAEVTHAHPEAIAGAVAVAAAAAWAWRVGQGAAPSFATLLDLALPYVPKSAVAAGIRRATELSPGAPPLIAAATLGSGISAHHTVPYALWCAASCLNDYPAALWQTAIGRGDVGANCAIVGGIVALAIGEAGIPAEWRESREPLPSWPFHASDSS